MGVVVNLGGVADGVGDIVLFEGYDGCHFVVCMLISLVGTECWVFLNGPLRSGDVSRF